MRKGVRFAGLAVTLVALTGFVGSAEARPGALDPGFGTNGIARTAPDFGGSETPTDLALGPDGSLVVAGSATQGPGSIVFKYLPDGSPDPGFGDQGQVRTNGDGWDQVEILGDGRIPLAGGAGTDLDFARLNADGSADMTFGGSGSVTLSTSGIFAPQQGVIPDASVSSLALMGDDSLRAIGTFAGCGNDGYNCAGAFIAGIDEGGDPVATFGPGGVKNAAVGGAGLSSVTLPDGSSLLLRNETGDPPFGDLLYATPLSAAGVPGETIRISRRDNFYWSSVDNFPGGITLDSSSRILFTDGVYLWRLLPDGNEDPDFGESGRVHLRDLIRFLPDFPSFETTGVTVDEQGRILVSGGIRGDLGQGPFFGESWASSGAVARLEADGSIDSSFGGGGLRVLWKGKPANAESVGDTSIVPLDGGVIVAGAGPVGPDIGFTLARVHNDEMEMPSCGGKRVDYVGFPGNDRIVAYDAVVSTRGGDDRIEGFSRTVICAGTGADSVDLESGPSTVFGGSGEDRIKLGRNGSTAHGGSGDDRIIGSDWKDRLYGNSGSDLLLGGGRNDRLFGGPGKDRLFGQGGLDWLFGGADRDRLAVGPAGPDLTDYIARIPGGQIRVTTRGFTANVRVRAPMTCKGKEDFVQSFSIRGIPFDANSGDLSRPPEKDAKLSDDFVSIFGLDSRVRNGSIAGRFRRIDGEHYFSNYLCRTGSGAFVRNSALEDSWVNFSARAEPKPRQLARQN